MPDDESPLLSSGGDTNKNSSNAALAIKSNKNIDGVDPNAPDAYVDLKKTNMRWCMLFMACCFLLGSYFCYDNPGPIET